MMRRMVGSLAVTALVGCGSALPPFEGEVEGFDYVVSIVADSFDFGSGRAAVHWSAGALNDTGDGQPVWVLTSRARRGSWRASEVLRVTASGLDIRIDSAIAAGGTFGLTGNAKVSGVNVDENGHPVDATNPSTSGACEENKAAFVVEDGDGVEARGSSDLDGNPTYSGNDPPYVVADPAPTPVTPEEVLGLPAGALDELRRTPAEFAADPVSPLEGIVYLTGDFGTGAGSGPRLDGTGVLIIHNPLFDPREHDPSDLLYDPSRVADRRYAPAVLGNTAGGTFRGVIIADRIDKFSGQATVYGAVVTLSRTYPSSLAGKATIQYSCAAVQIASRTMTRPRRLSWASGLEIAP